MLWEDFDPFEDVQKLIRVFSTVPEFQYAHLEPIVPISYFPAKPGLGKKEGVSQGHNCTNDSRPFWSSRLWSTFMNILFIVRWRCWSDIDSQETCVVFFVTSSRISSIKDHLVKRDQRSVVNEWIRKLPKCHRCRPITRRFLDNEYVNVKDFLEDKRYECACTGNLCEWRFSQCVT